MWHNKHEATSKCMSALAVKYEYFLYWDEDINLQSCNGIHFLSGCHNDINFKRKLLKDFPCQNLILSFINLVLLEKTLDFNIIFVNIYITNLHNYWNTSKLHKFHQKQSINVMTTWQP